MTQTEFENLTGIYVTPNHYALIEQEYYAFDGNKVEFCRAYKENIDGLAKKIQMEALTLRNNELSKVKDKDDEIAELKEKVACLTRKLEGAVCMEDFDKAFANTNREVYGSGEFASLYSSAKEYAKDNGVSLDSAVVTVSPKTTLTKDGHPAILFNNYI